MEDSQKISLVIRLLNEVTSSQDLGETASDIMGIDENDLYDVISVAVHVLESVDY